MPVIACFDGGAEGQPLHHVVHGVLELEPGEHAFFELQLDPHLGDVQGTLARAFQRDVGHAVRQRVVGHDRGIHGMHILMGDGLDVLAHGMLPSIHGDVEASAVGSAEAQVILGGELRKEMLPLPVILIVLVLGHVLLHGLPCVARCRALLPAGLVHHVHGLRHDLRVPDDVLPSRGVVQVNLMRPADVEIADAFELRQSDHLAEGLDR